MTSTARPGRRGQQGSSHTHVEHLRVLEDVGTVVNDQLASDDDENGSSVGSGGLSVEGQHSVDDLGKGEALVNQLIAHVTPIWREECRSSMQLIDNRKLQETDSEDAANAPGASP
jgi:hypothetical protein